MQSNRYWSSVNPYLTHEIPLHSVKVGVCCALGARGAVVPVFFNETINYERRLRVEGQHFQHLLWSVNCNYFIPNVIGRQACWFIAKLVRASQSAENQSPEAQSRGPGEQNKNPPCICNAETKRYEITQFRITIATNCKLFSRQRTSEKPFVSMCRVYSVSADNILMWMWNVAYYIKVKVYEYLLVLFVGDGAKSRPWSIIR
jgi:hypothetical protein